MAKVNQSLDVVLSRVKGTVIAERKFRLSIFWHTTPGDSSLAHLSELSLFSAAAKAKQEIEINNNKTEKKQQQPTSSEAKQKLVCDRHLNRQVLG